MSSPSTGVGPEREPPGGLDPLLVCDDTFSESNNNVVEDVEELNKFKSETKERRFYTTNE